MSVESWILSLAWPVLLAVLAGYILYNLLQFVEYTFYFESTVEADFDTVSKFWSDVTNLLNIHPYLKKVELLEERTEGDSTISKYKIVEKVAYLPLTAQYESIQKIWATEGKLSINQTGSVYGGAINLDATIVITRGAGKSTKIEETARLSILRLLSVTVSQFTEAQQGLLDKGKEYIEKIQ